ncbi:hypothetical protein CSUI_003200 [Cystoisospora suis]|uniref:Dynein regulatory complex protein 10 n=1 Tax=Cystoisospora suis TaxID=483139 RepID=A0A2C6KFZ1_9APIC|nr:hypothetical protein CSUI_003200 [Cystoisospora suis]
MKPPAASLAGGALSSASPAPLNSPQVSSTHTAPGAAPNGSTAGPPVASNSSGGGGGTVYWQLSPVEAFRAVVLIEEALRQLLFVSKLVPSSNSSQNKNQLDELAISKGDEIVKMIKEQSLLEEKFKELTDAKQKLKGLSNIEKLRSVENELEEISQKMRESNKELCRSLKQNPNIQENAVKLQLERQKIQEWYADLLNEVKESFTFKSLQDRVTAEKHQQEKLNEIKKRTRESTQAVRLLEAELKKETAEYEREMKYTNAEINKLKEELQQNRLRSSLKLSFEEKQLAAQEASLLRVLQQKEVDLEEALVVEQKRNVSEETSHAHLSKFAKEYILKVQKERQEWYDRFTQETEEKQRVLTDLLKHQNTIMRTLAVTQQRLDDDQEHREKEEKDAMQKAQILIERSRQEERLANDSVKILRHFARLYLKKVQDILEAQKSKKKGKGGGKKGGGNAKGK